MESVWCPHRTGKKLVSVSAPAPYFNLKKIDLKCWAPISDLYAYYLWLHLYNIDSIANSKDIDLSKLPGDSGGLRCLACYSPWYCRESDTT